MEKKLKLGGVKDSDSGLTALQSLRRIILLKFPDADRIRDKIVAAVKNSDRRTGRGFGVGV